MTGFRLDKTSKKLGFAEYVTKAEKRLALPWAGLTGLRCTGMKLYEVYASIKNQLEIAELMEQEFHADFTGIMDDGIICSETLGLKIKQYDFDFPAVQDHPVKTMERLSRLHVPDPMAGGRMLINIQSVQALAASSDKPLAISIEGPFTLAGQLAGIEHLARAVIADPDFALNLLDFTARVVKQYAKAVSKAGADLISIAEPSSIILSPEQFKQFVVPGVRQIFHDLDAWKMMHICGDTSLLLEEILSCRIEGLSLDQVMNIPLMMKIIPEDIVVFGNIDPLKVMLEMDAKGVAKETSSLLSAVDDYPNFIMSTGCDCVLETPFENLKAMVDTTHGHPLKKPLNRPENQEIIKNSIKALKPEKPQPVQKTSIRSRGIIPEIRQAVIDYDQPLCRSLCQKAVALGINPFTAMEKGLSSGMEQAGDLFSTNIYFIPELLMCTDALYAGLDELKPHMRVDEIKDKGKLMIGVIEGDLHEIGKNLVIALFTAAGWEICDLGNDVSTKTFVEAYQKNRPDLVGISALMNTSMQGIPALIKALRDCNPKVRILVGGAPLTREKALGFGADGYAVNAVQAVREGVKIIKSDHNYTISRNASILTLSCSESDSE